MRFGVPRSPAGGYNSRMASPSSFAIDTFRATLDLFETGIRLMRQNLRRDDPEATEQELDRRLRQWLHDRPGAESGDCPGRPVDVGSRLG
jgi:Rv0078B-related antitoxin